MSTGLDVDPWLAERIDAELRITQAEQVLYDAWWGAYTTWLAAVKRSVLAGPAPDPHAVWAHAPLWGELMATFVAGPVADIIGMGYAPIFGDTYPYTERPAVVAHLAAVSDRLKVVPDRVHTKLANLISAAANAGDTAAAILAAVTDTLTPTPPVRRDMFALTAAAEEDLAALAATLPRTEAISALNAGRADAFTAVDQELGGGLLNQWLSTLDGRTRPDHLEADGQRVAVDEPFSVGGESLMYPGDPAGSPAQTYNCRCTVLLIDPLEDVDMSNRGWQDWDDVLDEDVEPSPWHGTLDRQQAALARTIRQTPEIRPLGLGMVGETNLLTYSDGSRTVHKVYGRRAEGLRDLTESVDAEQLGVRVVEAVGLRAPALLRTGRTEFYMEWVDGDIGYDRVAYGAGVPATILASSEGRLMGLADHLMNNYDRNPGNWILTSDGRLVGLDHGSAFYPKAQSSSEFSMFLYDTTGARPKVARNDFTPNDIATVRTRLERLRGDFERLGRLPWWNAMMKRLDRVAKAAVGTTDMVPG